MPTNSHIPISTNDIPSEVVYTPGVGPSALQGGTQSADANGNTSAPAVFDLSSHGEQTQAVASAKSSLTVVKASAGRLGRILVTTTGTNAMLVYDNASAASGTIIGVVPASATVGTVIESGMPAANGITVGGNASNPGVTISFT